MTLVEGDLKAHFSIPTSPSKGKGATPFSGLLHLILDPYFIMLSVKQCGISNIMAEGFRFMPLGLVRQRTFRLSTWVSKVQH